MSNRSVAPGAPAVAPAPARPSARVPAPGPLAVALVIGLIACNLRPALTAIGPVLPEIMRDVGLGATAASLLTTLPILCLGVFGAVAPALAWRLGLERTIVLALLVLTGGLLLRALPGGVMLFAGSLLAGAAIGVGNVLMPAVLKRLPGRPGLPTGLYTMALCLGAAVAAGATVPLARAAGGAWTLALAAWAVPAALAALAAALTWRGALARPHVAADGRAGALTRALLRDRLAWQVTLFMGLQSTVAYGVFAWLAPILRGRGDDARTAGIVVATSILAQVAFALPTPPLAMRLRGQSGLAAATMVLIVASLFGLTRAPLGWQWACALALGAGMGAAFALAIVIIVLRSADAGVATGLSGMAQSVGYVMASSGPLAIGVLHDRGGGWGGAEALFLLAGGGAAVAGAFAGRPRLVRPPA